MRAAVYDPAALGGVRLTRVAPPDVASNVSTGVLCEVLAAGVNPVDAKYLIGDKLPEGWMGLASRVVRGTVPGFDFSGVVIDAPHGSGHVPGDSVFGLAADPTSLVRGRFRGSFAQRVLAPLDQIARKPEQLTHVEAAALPLIGTTCLQVFAQHDLRQGQRLLIIGASGGVGYIATQIASRLGAQVIAVCSAKNVGVVQAGGATRAISYEGDVLEKLTTEATVHGPFDLVLDCVHSADARDQAVPYASWFATARPPLIARGVDSDPHNYVVLGGRVRHWAMAGVKRTTGINWFAPGFELFWIRMPGAAVQLEQLRGMVRDGLRPMIDQALPFDQGGVRAAFEKVRSRRTVGKIVLDMSHSAIADAAI